ncbi:hypothetical protein DCS_00064 [Drechmeria coniospora]|uniref:Uncharacterized protein n=1 Tax=Drechmeria coniospora TaxID=98403 RepID=A0A151GPA7_DRECN|nr:hypothetical protein DCS_00064 [Drechmeria coniospora]KYK58937.1 hypothetical protein DCS_00064 [Drechmeria coniospora]
MHTVTGIVKGDRNMRKSNLDAEARYVPQARRHRQARLEGQALCRRTSASAARQRTASEGRGDAAYVETDAAPRRYPLSPRFDAGPRDANGCALARPLVEARWRLGGGTASRGGPAGRGGGLGEFERARRRRVLPDVARARGKQRRPIGTGPRQAERPIGTGPGSTASADGREDDSSMDVRLVCRRTRGRFVDGREGDSLADERAIHRRTRGRFVDGQGRFVDGQGRFVDGQGRFVDGQGRFVDGREGVSSTAAGSCRLRRRFEGVAKGLGPRRSSMTTSCVAPPARLALSPRRSKAKKKNKARDGRVERSPSEARLDKAIYIYACDKEQE